MGVDETSEACRPMKSAIIFFLQVFVLANVAYGAWYLLYGVPDVGYLAWIGILLVASSIGLVPVLIRTFSRGVKRGSRKS